MRFFGEIKNNKAILGDGDLHHLLNVMRKRVGDQIDVVYAGDTYRCEISSLNPLSIDVVEILNDDVELKSNLTLAFALLKGGHDELVYMKGTELGVKTFAPFISKRTIISLPSDKDKAKKKDRAEKMKKNKSISVYRNGNYMMMILIKSDKKKKMNYQKN